jgi:hypothetical protein
MMSAAIQAHFGQDKFVTALVEELDLLTGLWSWITCGHPPALLLRRGRVAAAIVGGFALRRVFVVILATRSGWPTPNAHSAEKAPERPDRRLNQAPGG